MNGCCNEVKLSCRYWTKYESCFITRPIFFKRLLLSRINFNNEIYLHSCCNRPLDSEPSASITKEVASGWRVSFLGICRGSVNTFYDIQSTFNEGRTLAIFGELLQVLLQICASTYWLYVNIILVRKFAIGAGYVVVICRSHGLIRERV